MRRVRGIPRRAKREPGTTAGAVVRQTRWLFLAAVAAALAGPAAALESGMHTDPAIATSPVAPLRQALILAPSPDGGAVASDADAYRTTLRLLGFEVTTIVADSRLELDADLQRAAATIRPDADVAVLMLGTVLAHGKSLYLTAKAPLAEVIDRPETFAAEGLSLNDLLVRILDRSPKEVVAIVDTCREPEGSGACLAGAAALADGVSGLVTYRRKAQTAGRPLARLASLREDLVALMTTPGKTLFADYDALRQKLVDTDMELAASPALSRTFVFLPTEFMARLPIPCNRVDVGADEATLRALPIDTVVASCANAAATWSFAPDFARRLAVAREQAAFVHAVARCGDPRLETYRQTYPGGTHRTDVERFAERCDDERARAGAQADTTASRPTSLSRSALVPRRGAQPSFTCTPSLSEPVAQLICADAELAAADARLGLAYRRRLAGLRSPAQRRALAEQEVAWLQRRESTCGIPVSGAWDPADLAGSKPCLLDLIKDRLRALD